MRIFLFSIFSGLLLVSPNQTLHGSSLDKQISANKLVSVSEAEAKKLVSSHMKSGTKDMRDAMEIILQEGLYTGAESGPNYALELFIWLLSRDAAVPGDGITMALALANNHIYALSDDETRKLIKRDMLDHFRYYKKVLKYQKNFSLAIDLSKAPVLAKVIWADRARKIDMPARGKKINKKRYLEFIDRIENLQKMHSLVKGLELERMNSLQHLAHAIEKYTRRKDILEYRAEIKYLRRRAEKEPDNKNLQQALKDYENGEYKIEYFGKTRRWDHFSWLNYQVKRLRKKGRIRGDCVTITTFQMNLYKAAGIPALAEQIWSVNPKYYHHNSPRFYNPFTGRWVSRQKPAYDKQGYYNYFEKPVYHHKLYERYGKRQKKRKGLKVYNIYWPGEKASYEQIISHRRLGFSPRDFKRLLLSRETITEAVIFTNKSAPMEINDKDGDGIPDKLEYLYKTSAGSFDSDNDGIADLWEIEHGYDPLAISSPGSPRLPVIDGLSQLELHNSQHPIRYDPKDDYKADNEIHDVKGITARRYGNQLYIAVSYHNDIRQNSRKVRTLRISEHGSKTRRHFLQWINGVCKVYKDDPSRSGGKRLTLKRKENWPMGTLKETEFLIPISFFDKGADTLFIRYQATGSIKGKTSNSCDYSKRIRFDIKNNYSARKINEALKNSTVFKDDKGDVKGASNIHDIETMQAAVRQDRLYLRIEYHNDIDKLDDVIHTVEIRDPLDKKNKLFFQTWDLSFCNLWRKDKKRVLSPNKAFTIFRIKNGFLFEFDISLLKCKEYQVRYRAGSHDKRGKNVINSDMCGYHTVK